MLIAQAPLRISLFGGGSDLPGFLEHYEGAVLSFAITRRVYIVGHPLTHRRGVLLKYSKSEDVEAPALLEHPIARVILERYGVSDIDIAVMSDVRAGTGLGSSSTFTVAFLAFVRHLCGIPSSSADLATEACEIEIDVLREPIGFQDQWASALGGVNLIRFRGRDVSVESMMLPATAVQALENRLHLVPVGRPRSAGALLRIQSEGLASDPNAVQSTRQLVGLVDQGREALLTDLDALGPLLEAAWHIKRGLARGISTPEIDELYERGRSVGATGGKLLGAGSSGYVMFYVPPDAQERFVQTFPKQLDFSISDQGAGVVHES